MNVGVKDGVGVVEGVGVSVGTGVGVAVGIGVGVALGVGVRVGVAVGTGVGVAVGARVGVAEGVGLGVSVGVAVGTGVGVAVGARVGVAEGVGLGVSVGVAVDRGVWVGVLVGVCVAVGTGVCVAVCVAVCEGVCVGVLVSMFVTIDTGVNDDTESKFCPVKKTHATTATRAIPSAIARYFQPEPPPPLWELEGCFAGGGVGGGEPGFSILGVFRLNGQPKRDDGIIIQVLQGQSIVWHDSRVQFRAYKGRLSPRRPRRDDHSHRRTEALARADRRGTRTSRSP